MIKWHTGIELRVKLIHNWFDARELLERVDDDKDWCQRNYHKRNIAIWNHSM